MIKKFKKKLKKISWINNLVKAKLNAKWWMSDIRSAFFSKATKLKETPYGFKLKGSNSIHHVRMQDGKFEIEEVEIFQKIYKKSDVFVDVGANIGFYSCLAKHLNLHVIAIEPLQKNLRYHFENLKENNWDDVEVFPVGLAKCPSIGTLYGGSSTGASLIESWAGASKIFRKKIALSTLDILIGNRFYGKNIFIKIDVEGAEYQVLLGALHTMASHPKPTWVLEICYNEYHPESVNPDYQKIFNLFWENGYECHTANSENKLITQEDVKEWTKNRVCKSGSINYIFEEKINLF
jgi:FkbM family methyltransferase